MIGGFHHNVERGVLVKQPRKWEDGTWDYPPLEGDMQAVMLEEMKTYIHRRHNAVAKYIVMRPILELCLEVEWRPASRVTDRWWDQEGLVSSS